MKLGDPRKRILQFKARKLSYRYLLAEFIWYMSGENSIDPIVPYAPFWRQIADDNGTVNSAYGNRIFGKNEIIPLDQWEWVKNKLFEDKDSRQAIIHINHPHDMMHQTKDFPCTLSLQFFIRNDRLDLIVNMRSNDIVLGLTNDLFQFTMLQEIMCLQLRKFYPDLVLGSYIHNAGSLHVYERHFEMLGEIRKSVINLEETSNKAMISMSEKDVEQNQFDSLVKLERDWRTQSNCDKDYNFDVNPNFINLTRYWKTLVKVCFGGMNPEILFV